MKLKNKTAFTLVELITVFGIAAAVLAISYLALYPKVRGLNKVDVESRNIETINTGAINLYAMNGTFTNISNASLINARVIPLKLIDPDNAGRIYNAFSGDVVITPAGLGGGATNSFRITWPRVPDFECFYLVRQLALGTYKQIGINGVTGANLIKPYPPNSNIPLDLDALGALCANNNDNTIYLWNN